jgi:cytochrome b6-f complex iron-sulfur subunit
MVGETLSERVVSRQEHIWTRREFFSLSGWLGICAVLAVWGVSLIRFMFPRVLFEPSPVFKAGFPDDYSVGEVSEKFKATQRVWIVRDEEGIFALLAICTHLGCTPRWLPAENKFKCPCHGSGFTKDGVNFEGPAPRPLERLKITLAEDRQLLIDKSKKYLYEKGEWGKPGSFLKA